MKIVVTGALGHIGSALVRQLPLHFPKARIVMVDNMMTQRYPSLFNLPAAGHYQFVEGDVRKIDLRAVVDGAQALADGAKALAANPETLSAELQILFREQGLETVLVSVAEAMRKYQNPAAAQELVAAAAESGASRDRLEQYVVNLASTREKEYQVMDQETQRCRAQMLATPPPAKKKK